MTGIRVHIPTTEGPSEIQRITLEDPDVRSVVCLDGKAVALPISADYDAFVRAPTGVIEAGFGHSAFRLDVSQEITEGLSWQLAAYAAHALHAADRLAMREQAAHRVIWLTGEVDCALNIRPVRHVARKLRQSGRLIADLAAAGMPLTIYIPRENHAELDDETLLAAGIDDLNCRIVPVDQISHVLADLRLPARRKSGYSASAPKSAKWLPWVTAPLAVLAGLTVLAVGASLTAPQKNIAAIQPPASLLTRVSMTAGPARALSFASLTALSRPGGGCTEADIAVAENGLPKTGLLGPAQASGLCDLRYRLTNRGNTPIRVTAVGARRDEGAELFRTRVFLDDYELRPGAYVDLDARPPRRMHAKLTQQFLIAALPYSAAARRATLKNLVGAAGKPMKPLAWLGWRDRLARASDADLTSATQEIHP